MHRLVHKRQMRWNPRDNSRVIISRDSLVLRAIKVVAIHLKMEQCFVASERSLTSREAQNVFRGQLNERIYAKLINSCIYICIWSAFSYLQWRGAR